MKGVLENVLFELVQLPLHSPDSLQYNEAD